MKLLLAAIAPRPLSGALQQLVQEYVRRTTPYFAVEAPVYRSETALLEAVSRLRGRTTPVLVLLDSRGTALDSGHLAALLDTHRQAGTQQLVLAVGPANGWTEAARGRAGLLLSLGPMTLPHELARLVLAEQVYRAATILAGHPYHCGH